MAKGWRVLLCVVRVQASGLLVKFLGAEAEGEEGFDARNDIDLGVGAKQDLDGRTITGFTLANDLTAGAARRADFFAELVALPADDGQFADRNVGIVGSGIEESRPLGTEARGVGGILLIAAGDDYAVVEEDGSAHFVVRIRGI